MAHPQPDKFVRISTELLEALCKTKLNSEARNVFDFIIRKIYGFNKKKDVISTSQIIEGTGLSRRSVERARRKLIEDKMITTGKTVGTMILTYSIQKDYEKWSGYRHSQP